MSMNIRLNDGREQVTDDPFIMEAMIEFLDDQLKLKKRVEALEGALKTVENDRLKWDFFLLLPSATQQNLLESCSDPWALEEALAELMDRPSQHARYPANEEQLSEEAGRAADAYRGQGWMYLRQAFTDFHKRLKKLEM